MVLILNASQPLQSMEDVTVWVARKMVVTELRSNRARTVRVVVRAAST